MAAKQLGVALDSSCLIALLCEWHDQHLRTTRSYQRYFEQDTRIIIPAHALLECYSVLTRLPAPFRFSPETAMELIEENFIRSATIIGTKVETTLSLLKNLARNRVGGGQVYDGLIAASAADAGATVLLTWNVRHFASIASAGLEVRQP
jgi:predicted nucleic acid-binding protein